MILGIFGCKIAFLALAPVKRDPSPQNVPPPVAVPPIRSKFDSLSTFRIDTPDPIMTSKYGYVSFS